MAWARPAMCRERTEVQGVAHEPWIGIRRKGRCPQRPGGPRAGSESSVPARNQRPTGALAWNRANSHEVSVGIGHLADVPKQLAIFRSSGVVGLAHLCIAHGRSLRAGCFPQRKEFPRRSVQYIAYRSQGRETNRPGLIGLKDRQVGHSDSGALGQFRQSHASCGQNLIEMTVNPMVTVRKPRFRQCPSSPLPTAYRRGKLQIMPLQSRPTKWSGTAPAERLLLSPNTEP